MKKRIFITSVVPKKYIEKLDISAAANYFSYQLIDANIFDKVYSFVPTNIDKEFEKETKIKYLQKRFRKSSKLTKLLSTILDNIKLFQSVEKKSKLWYYNLTHQNVLNYILIKIFKPSVQQYIIVLDHTPSKYLLTIQGILLKLINGSDGLISLTNNDVLSDKNKVIIPGIAPNAIKGFDQKTLNFNFLLSGILSNNRLPELFLELFSHLPEYNLIITGKIIDDVLIEKYVNNFPNIKYLGMLEYNKYLEVLKNASFSLNTRDPKYIENLFNFPSKSLEHLRYNRILISTMYYEEIKDINYFYKEPELESLLIFFKELKYCNQKELLEKYANQSVKVVQLFGIDKWEKAVSKIENI